MDLGGRMTLLKAYLLGTKDPFMLAKVFYEDTLLKDSAAVDEEINKILGFAWKEYYDWTVRDIEMTKLDLEEVGDILTDWDNELERLKIQVSQLTTDDPKELTSYPDSDYSLVQEIEDFQKEHERLFQVGKGYIAKIKKDEEFLKKLENKRNEVAKKLSGFTHDEMLDPSLLYEAKYEIHQLGLSLLNKEKKLLDDLTTGELAEIMKIPYPKEMQDMLNNYKKNMLREKSGRKRVAAWNKLEAQIKQFGGDVGKKREHEKKLRIIDAKIKNSKNSLKDFATTEKSKENHKLAQQAVDDFKLEPNEKLEPTLGYLTFKRVLETTNPKTKKVTRKLLNKYKWNSETKQLEEVKEQVKEKYEGAFEVSEVGTFSSDKFWQSFLDGYKSKRNMGSNSTIKNALKIFLEEYENSGEKELEVKPEPIIGDSYGVNVDVEEERGPIDIGIDKKKKLKNLNMLKNIFESFEEPLKNSRSVNYILEAIESEINFIDKDKTSKVKVQEKVTTKAFKKLLTVIKRAYGTIEYYSEGEYPDKFIIEVNKLKESEHGIEDLFSLSEGEIPTSINITANTEKISNLKSKLKDLEEDSTEQIKLERELRGLERIKQSLVKKSTIKDMVKTLNKKNKSGHKQSLINHIDTVWESEQLKNYGKMSPETRKELIAARKSLESSLSRKKGIRESGSKREEKVKKPQIKAEQLEKITTDLKEFLEEIKDMDEDLTSEELKKYSTKYKKLSKEYNRMKLNTRGLGKLIGNTWRNITKIMSEKISPAGYGKSESSLPDDKMKNLGELATKLQYEVHNWKTDKNNIFKNKDGKWDENQVRTYVNQAIPPADEKLLSPRLKSDFKAKIKGRIKTERNRLINKIMQGFDIAGLKGGEIKGKDLSWIIEQVGAPKEWSAKDKKKVPTMLGEFDEPKPRFRVPHDYSTGEGEEELTESEAQELFGEGSKGYEASGDSAKERADNAAERREEIKEIYGE